MPLWHGSAIVVLRRLSGWAMEKEPCFFINGNSTKFFLIIACEKSLKICFGAEAAIKDNFSFFADILTEAIDDQEAGRNRHRRRQRCRRLNGNRSQPVFLTISSIAGS